MCLYLVKKHSLEGDGRTVGDGVWLGVGLEVVGAKNNTKNTFESEF